MTTRLNIVQHVLFWHCSEALFIQDALILSDILRKRPGFIGWIDTKTSSFSRFAKKAFAVFQRGDSLNLQKGFGKIVPIVKAHFFSNIRDFNVFIL